MAFRSLRSTCALLGMSWVLMMGAASHAAADSINVEWDEVGPDIGYRVHVGTQSGSYTEHFDVGSTTLFTFTAAAAGQRYCFAVSAYLMSSLLEGPNSTEVCGYSNTAPTLVNPGNRSSMVGQAVTLQLVGSDPESQPLTYSATGLPPGLSLMASTGFISGAGTTAGTYAVTVRASDGVLTASQSFSWAITAATDTTRPSAMITEPTTSNSYTTTSSTISLSGSASDDIGVTQVRWSNERGGSGVASGTANWSVAGIPLLGGTNVITVTAVDAAGNQGTDSLTVTYAPGDTTRPVVSITSPTSSSTYTTSSSTIPMAGAASDNVGVTQVRWASDRGASGVASGTTNWSISGVPLLDGTNVITVTAMDAAGNQATVSLTVTYLTPTTTVSPVTLKAEPRKSRRWRSTRLSWTNATWPSVDIYRNGMFIGSTPNDGLHTDPIFGKGSFTYQICSPGSTTTCSNTATVYF